MSLKHTHLEFNFTCSLPNGVHARPANNLEEVTKQFTSSITVINERNGAEADAKSVLSLVAADIKQNDTCCVSIKGKDQNKAFAAIKSFVENVFPGCDEPLPQIETAAGETPLPVMLESEKVSYIRGTPVSPGFGRGAVVVAGGLSIPQEISALPSGGSENEWKSLRKGLDSLQDEIQQKLGERLAPTEAAVLKAHLSIVRDPALAKKLQELVYQNPQISAAQAIIRAYEFFADTLKNAESAYIRERVIDIQDICMRLIKTVYGTAGQTERMHLSEPTILAAENLAPSVFLALDRQYLRGLVLGHAGKTSHTVILARTFGIPALAGITDVTKRLSRGQEVIVDADAGILVDTITPAIERYYAFEDRKRIKRREKLEHAAKTDAFTSDRKRLEVAANISLPEEAHTAFAAHAEGIGLFRTEMLFLHSGDAPPTEEQQYQAFRHVVHEAAGRPVIIRTLDIGGDKPLPYLALPAESNPFLGYRAVRMYADFPDMIKNQLHAAIRASAHGTVKVMVPMVSQINEITRIRNIIRDIRSELADKGIPFDADMQVGIMVEVPSVAFAIDQFSNQVDFFSIGTNDLLQYFIAVDRENRSVSHLYNFLHPSFIRLLRKIIDDAHQHGKWIGMCGEMAGDLHNLPLLAGLGLDEISLGAHNIPQAKAAVAKLDSSRCTDLAAKAMRCGSPEEVSSLLDDFFAFSIQMPVLDTQLIITDAHAANKREAIKELCDALYLAERTENPAAVERDVWSREQVYSTDMGYGIAIPHCKTKHVTANSIAVLKPKTPLSWVTAENKPVKTVILLAIKESEAANSHMKIFARLARKVMHDDFREYLAKANDPEDIRQFLQKSLEI